MTDVYPSAFYMLTSVLCGTSIPLGEQLSTSAVPETLGQVLVFFFLQPVRITVSLAARCTHPGLDGQSLHRVDVCLSAGQKEVSASAGVPSSLSNLKWLSSQIPCSNSVSSLIGLRVGRVLQLGLQRSPLKHWRWLETVSVAIVSFAITVGVTQVGSTSAVSDMPTAAQAD